MEEMLKDARLDPHTPQCLEDRETSLHHAAMWQSVNAVELLLSLRLDVDAVSSCGETALHIAVEYSDSSRGRDIVSLLLDAGASTQTKRTVDGYTVWHIAAKKNDEIALKAFLMKDGNRGQIHVAFDEGGLLPIFTAAYSGSVAAFELLLLHMENLEGSPYMCPKGVGLVHYAASLNSAIALRILQDRGDQLDQRTKDGQTGLHFIPGNAHLEVIQVLLDAGIEVAAPADDGSLAIHAGKSVV